MPVEKIAALCVGSVLWLSFGKTDNISSGYQPYRSLWLLLLWLVPFYPTIHLFVWQAPWKPAHGRWIRSGKTVRVLKPRSRRSGILIEGRIGWAISSDPLLSTANQFVKYFSRSSDWSASLLKDCVSATMGVPCSKFLSALCCVCVCLQGLGILLWVSTQDYNLSSRHFALSVLQKFGTLPRQYRWLDFIYLISSAWHFPNISHCGIWLWFALDLFCKSQHFFCVSLQASLVVSLRHQRRFQAIALEFGFVSSDWSAFWLLHLLQLIALNLLSAFERPAPLTA